MPSKRSVRPSNACSTSQAPNERPTTSVLQECACAMRAETCATCAPNSSRANRSSKSIPLTSSKTVRHARKSATVSPRPGTISARLGKGRLTIRESHQETESAIYDPASARAGFHTFRALRPRDPAIALAEQGALSHGRLQRPVKHHHPPVENLVDQKASRIGRQCGGLIEALGGRDRSVVEPVPHDRRLAQEAVQAILCRPVEVG